MITYIEQENGDIDAYRDNFMIGTIKKVSGGYAFYQRFRTCCGGKTYRSIDAVKEVLEK